MNPERILIAAEAIGLGMLAIKRSAKYANERIVFNRPIGQNQGIQHPLAKCWAELEAAWMMVLAAAWQYDQGMPCGGVANAAKYGAQFLLQPPRPPHWGGYRLKPDNWQFWQGRKSRLHGRLRYTLDDQSHWLRERLAP